MMRSSFGRRCLIAAGLVLAIGLTAVIWIETPGVIRAAYEGRSISFLNGIVKGQAQHSADEYIEFFQRAFGAGVLAFAALGAFGAWLTRWHRQAGTLRRGQALLILFGFLTVIGLFRLIYYHEPFERDLMVYTTIAEGMLEGRPLYSEMWDHKPPAIHVTYAAAVATFGATPLAIWMLGFGAAAVTLWLCYEAGRAGGGRTGGLVAAGVWMLASGDLLLEANQPNVEVFMNACLAAAFVLVLRSAASDAQLPYAAAGALFFLATLYKPVVAVTACAVIGMSVMMALFSARQRADQSKTSLLAPRFRNAAVAAGVAAAGWLSIVGYFLAAGRFGPFWEAVVEYNRDYAGDVTGNVLGALVPSVDALWTLVPYLPMIGGAVLVGVLALRGPHRWQWSLLLAYIASAWVAVALPGRLYPHYFQLLLPPGAIGAGWIVAGALKRRSTMALAVCAILLAGPVAARAYQSMVPLEEVPVFKYGGYGRDLIETERMGPWLTRNLVPGDTLYHWGPDPGVYFYARRASPIGFVFNLPLLDRSSRAAAYSTRVVSALEHLQPTLVVARRLDLRTIDNPVEEWIQEHYTPVPGPPDIDRFLFLARRDVMAAKPTGPQLGKW